MYDGPRKFELDVFESSPPGGDSLRSQIRQAIDSVLRQDTSRRPSHVARFESEFATYCAVSQCIWTRSGHSALRAILTACGIGENDEVIIAGNSLLGTLAAVLATGATPVLVDCDGLTLTIDPASATESITGHTKAIIATHLNGQPADMTSLNRLAQAEGLRLIEDATHAHGATHRGRRCGSLADAAAFSFPPQQPLSFGGEAGAITTSDDLLARRLRQHRPVGGLRSDPLTIPSHRSRLVEMQAAVLRVKLPRLDEWNARRRRLAGRYDRWLAELPLTTPPVPPDCQHVFHRYVVRTPHREELAEFLQQCGVPTDCIPSQPMLRQFDCSRLSLRCGDLTQVNRMSRQSLTLPISSDMTLRDVRYIVECIRHAPCGSGPSHNETGSFNAPRSASAVA